MTSRECVKRTIAFQQPDRVPIWFFNRNEEHGDILCFDLALCDDAGRSEWGYQWLELDDGTMGQPGSPLIPEWDAFSAYTFPDPDNAARFEDVDVFMRRSEDYYRLASLCLSGFTIYTFLRGFENAMLDFVAEPEKAGELMDRIVAFENRLIRQAAERGFDGVHFADDWGTQSNLIISPDLWKRIFRPRYEQQFALAQSLGLEVWFHSCGNITALAEDFHAAGVDVLNISQPNVVNLQAVSECLRGRQCFMLPVSYQTDSIRGTPEQIQEVVSDVFGLLGTPQGGFIGYVEEYGSVGMSEANYQACIRAFRNLQYCEGAYVIPPAR